MKNTTNPIATTETEKDMETHTPKSKRIRGLKKIENILKICEETIEDDIRQMGPAERAGLWTQLQPFIRPKLSRTQVDAKIKNDKKKKPAKGMGDDVENINITTYKASEEVKRLEELKVMMGDKE